MADPAEPPEAEPHNLEAERSLLGAMLLSRDAVAAAVEETSADAFWRPVHGFVFEAITSLYAQGEGVDPVTVADELGRAGLLDSVGGVAALVTLTANTPSTSNAAHYARIVEEYATMRGLVDAGGKIAEMGRGADDVPEALDRAEAALDAVSARARGRRGRRTATADEALTEALDRLEAMADGEQGALGVATGLWRLDRKLAGLRPGQLIVVGGRPGHGKTSLGVHLAAQAAVVQRVGVLHASLEMGRAEVTDRYLAQLGGVDKDRLRRGELTDADWTKVSHAVGRMGGAPLWIHDDPGMTLRSLRSQARRMARSGLGLIVVDYLQLMSSDRRGENRQVEVAEISRGMKVLAGDLEVPVVALSQVSRNVEQRADKRPTLADLRESGALESDADAVIFLYRDEVYDRGSDRKGLMELIVAKQRNGPTGKVTVHYDARVDRLSDPEPAEQVEPLSMLDDA